MHGMKKESMMPKEEMVMSGMGIMSERDAMIGMPPEMARKMKMKKVAEALKKRRR